MYGLGGLSGAERTIGVLSFIGLDGMDEEATLASPSGVIGRLEYLEFP